MEEKNSKSVAGMMIVVVLFSVFVSWQIGYKQGVNKESDNFKNAISTLKELPKIKETLGINNVVGTVEKITGSEIIVKTFQAPSLKNDLLERTVVVDQATVIERLVAKDLAVIQREQTQFTEEMKKAGAGGANIKPPEPFTREKATINDIKIGDIIFASAGKDISKDNKFTAEKILIQSPLKTSNIVIPISAPKVN